MESDDRKIRRGLRDISHFFLSSAPVREQDLFHAKPPVLAVCVDASTDCAFEMNSMLAKNLELTIHQVDFHVAAACADFQDHRTSSALFCAPAVFEEIICSEEGKPCLADLPWNSPEIMDALLSLASAVLVTVRPSISSLKNTFRLLKGASCFLKEDPFVRWETNGNPDLAQIAFEWTDLVKHFLNRNLLWMDTLEPLKERLRNALSAVSVSSAAQQEESLRRERQRSLHFQRDFLAMASSETAASDPQLAIPFYERARLSQEELEAFFALTGRMVD